MAAASISEDEFKCSLCRILLNDPVTLPCGHTYCMRCITVNQGDQMRICKCPQCRQTFSPRPVLGKNELVAKMVEKLKTGEPQERICPQHYKVMEIYCIQCQRCICMLCFDEHRNHDTASISAANKEKRRRERDLQKLQQEIDDLKRTKAELEKISQTQDHIQFLQSLQCLSVSGSTENISVSSDVSFDDVVVKSVSQFRDKLLHFCKEEFHKISVTSILVPEPQSRMEFLKYFRQFTIDPNTVNRNLSLSGENRMATITVLQQYPDHPERFDHWMNMMCTESVSGRCYWEVEWSGQGRLGVDVAVAYKSISRKGVGLDSAAGRNDQSWNLFCSPIYHSFIHNNSEMIVSLNPSIFKVGVYVDHSAGILSFYRVSSDTMSLIHRVHTTFTQPLYPMFGMDEHSAFRLSRLTE
ncbi:Stonustoxin subunit beta [Triplophysa tibetana]|uniref:Stonustoxin subunit beta n=1 Tax=Triplophysa tibetana TaxID=1572043 RepID=A0A5A9NAN5_9TELE|nr:Stonustoxin subunit beta [Triplophysa tibetana]